MHPIVIIGSGMAGYTLAREFRKLNPEQELVMICADDAVNYAKPTLSNAFAGKKAPEQIPLGDAAKMSAQLNMRIEPFTWVKEILAERHELVLEKDGVISQQPYSKLILAVGANPIRLAIAGDGSDDIHVVNSLIDYRSFRENLAQRKDKRVVILGAGLIGCEFANDLLHSEYDVTVIDLAPQPLGRLLPSHIASAFQQNLEEAGVKFALGTTVEKV
ncbi:FAD-dependent oxidoreductase, partial [Acinetobacter baumannii]